MLRARMPAATIAMPSAPRNTTTIRRVIRSPRSLRPQYGVTAAQVSPQTTRRREIHHDKIERHIRDRRARVALVEYPAERGQQIERDLRREQRGERRLRREQRTRHE